MTTKITSMAELVAALREAVRERGVTYETVDSVGGLPDRYTSKALAPKPIKRMGYQNIGLVLGALGKALVLVDDPDQIERVKGRWTPRKRPLKSRPSTVRSTSTTNALTMEPSKGGENDVDETTAIIPGEP
jgi:hypothetical protein